ncbi:hypothetical protein BKA81DRAFT_96452 [Phyllosticta paracitricarpa]|uniref:Uncharacterized protein n=2 Tax=Phyllosticta TaxID=121621 RepID=A0ABR1MCM9_9PEZI
MLTQFWILLPSTLITTLILTADAAVAPSSIENAVLTSPDVYSDTLVDMLLRAPVYEPQVFEVAQKRIRDMESSPACQQLATSTLIDSCQSLDLMTGPDSQSVSQNPMDAIKKEYSARLAVCELQGIKDGVPRECNPFVPSTDACRSSQPRGFIYRYMKQTKGRPRRLCYPDFTQQELKTCANALFNHPQRWTSFSNARSNAIIICQASRAAVENDEYLRKLREAIDAQSGAAESLAQIIHEVQAAFNQQRAFTEAAHQFQSEVISKNEAALAQSDHVVTNIFAKFESSAQSALLGFQKYFDAFRNDADTLDLNLKDAGARVRQFQNGLTQIFDNAIAKDNERAASLDTALSHHQGQVDIVQNALDNVRDITVRDLAERVLGVEEFVKQQLLLVQQALEGQRTFQEIQTLIMENQTAIGTSLLAQQHVIEENSQKIKDLPFAGIGSVLATWLGLSLAIIIVSRVSIVLAAALACSAGAATWVESVDLIILGRVFNLEPSLLIPSPESTWARFALWTSLAAIVLVVGIVLYKIKPMLTSPFLRAQDSLFLDPLAQEEAFYPARYHGQAFSTLRNAFSKEEPHSLPSREKWVSARHMRGHSV